MRPKLLYVTLSKTVSRSFYVSTLGIHINKTGEKRGISIRCFWKVLSNISMNPFPGIKSTHVSTGGKNA
ncbi:hypothetical protein HanIR_Chr04g0172471 [Helianthus annuus]|nr:hypothetical protein HanIR_Chr04g0172471 [Helianthus annuus]